ncbi:hypothetical protein DVF53_24875 [Salmonella enterica subsp. enterica serovar Kottbus]|nr:hypothetical protein [Salmonella enterica subsp. enterica serovar Kottbus]
MSPRYTIAEVVTESPDAINTHLNESRYRADGTFPTTGFKGAAFTIVPSGGADAAVDYTWSADASWVSVTSKAVVTFTGTGTGDKVTITGTPKYEGLKTIVFSFTLKSWFIVNTNGGKNLKWSEASSYCQGQAGYEQPWSEELSYHPFGSSTATADRRTGSLWNEWGDLRNYPGAGFSTNYLWARDPTSSSGGYNYYVSLYVPNGFLGSTYGDMDNTISIHSAVCRRSL